MAYENVDLVNQSSTMRMARQPWVSAGESPFLNLLIKSNFLFLATLKIWFPYKVELWRCVMILMLWEHSCMSQCLNTAIWLAEHYEHGDTETINRHQKCASSACLSSVPICLFSTCLFLWVCRSLLSGFRKNMSGLKYRRCVTPLYYGRRLIRCVCDVNGGARSVLEESECVHCDKFS